jgi:hypothetical protein
MSDVFLVNKSDSVVRCTILSGDVAILEFHLHPEGVYNLCDHRMKHPSRTLFLNDRENTIVEIDSISEIYVIDSEWFSP